MFFFPDGAPRRAWMTGLALTWALGSARQLRVRVRRQASPPPSNPRPARSSEQVSGAYRALSSYSDQGHFVIAMTLGGKPTSRSGP
jgi:hypothetical protein